MCARYQLLRPQSIADRFAVLHLLAALDAQDANDDIRPTQLVAIVTAPATAPTPVPTPVPTTGRELRRVRWGLIPAWTKATILPSGLPSGARPRPQSKPLINARAETLDEKPSFRGPLRTSRCIIPATGFYEWATTSHGGRPGKQKLLFTRANGDFLAFAGLCDTWLDPASGREVRSCAMITTAANGTVAPIHDRMPVILRPQHEALWLDPTCRQFHALRDCLAPLPDDELVVRTVSAARVEGMSDDKPQPSRAEPAASQTA